MNPHVRPKHRAAEGCDADRIEPARVLIAGFDDKSGRRHGERGTDRKIDVKRPPPADGMCDQPARDRRHDHGEPHDPAPDRPGAIPVRLVMEAVPDDCECRRQQECGTCALEGAGEIERPGRGRKPAQKRGQREGADAGKEDPPAAITIRDRSRRQEQGRKAQHIGADHPFHFGKACAELPRDRRQHDGDDIGVEDRQGAPGRCRKKDGQRTAGSVRSLGVGRHQATRNVMSS